MCLQMFSCRPCLVRITVAMILFHSFYLLHYAYILYLDRLGYAVISYKIVQRVKFMAARSIGVK